MVKSWDTYHRVLTQPRISFSFYLPMGKSHLTPYPSIAMGHGVLEVYETCETEALFARYAAPRICFTFYL